MHLQSYLSPLVSITRLRRPCPHPSSSLPGENRWWRWQRPLEVVGQQKCPFSISIAGDMMTPIRHPRLFLLPPLRACKCRVHSYKLHAAVRRGGLRVNNRCVVLALYVIAPPRPFLSPSSLSPSPKRVGLTEIVHIGCQRASVSFRIVR
jgi:hypothetical protein